MEQALWADRGVEHERQAGFAANCTPPQLEHFHSPSRAGRDSPQRLQWCRLANTWSLHLGHSQSPAFIIVFFLGKRKDGCKIGQEKNTPSRFFSFKSMFSYVFCERQKLVEVSPETDQAVWIKELQKERDCLRIQRLCEEGVDKTYCVVVLFNRCQPQDCQFEVRAPQSFVGSRVPYFGLPEQIAENVKSLYLWFVLEHSDGDAVNHRYIGRLLERELYQERHTLRLHKRDTWFFGHRLVRDCLSFDGGLLHLAGRDIDTELQQQASAPPFQALTSAQFRRHCADDLRGFLDVDSGFLQAADRRDVDHYLCFVAFFASRSHDALTLLKTQTSAKRYTAFQQTYHRQVRECGDIAADAASFVKFRDFLKERSGEFHRSLKAHVQKLCGQQTQAADASQASGLTSSAASNSVTRTTHVA